MLQLRTYVKSDAETIISWVADERTCYMWSAGRFGQYPITPRDINRNYDGFETSNDFFPYTAVDDGKVIGHLIMRYPNPEDRSMIRFGFVIVDYLKRGRGYGARMLNEALRVAFAERGAEKVTLGVFRDNVPAALCYLSVGFHTPADDATPKEEIHTVFGNDLVCVNLEITREEFLRKQEAEAEMAPSENVTKED